MSKIDPYPKQPPSTDPKEDRYWDPRDLESELKRVFAVCHTCRMCVNYCGSFPDVFARVDRDIDNGAEGSERLGAEDFKSVTELCWQCKLCYIKCPYTPDEGHEWMIDFPRLMTREKAQRAKRNGVTLQDRALGEPGLLGKLTAGPQARVANFVNEKRLVRKIIQATAGISAEFPLPPFAITTFSKWLDSHDVLAEAGREGEVAIFATCQGDYNLPSAPANAVRVLEKNGYKVRRPEQVCCGIPNMDGGDIEGAIAKARINVASLLAEIDAGRPIVVPGPSCSYTIRKEYPELLGTADAKRVAENTFDLMEFLEKLRKEKKLNTEFEKSLGKVAYHAPCHLRAQKVGFPAARVLGTIRDTEVETIQECSVVDGTWGMKAQYYEMGRKYAQKLVRGVESVGPDVLVSDCPLAGLRLKKETGMTVRHPVEALAEAYGIAIAVE
ncbi:heterodisulfide reductase-related iron-sulfur binding cluster [soil metagenome]